MRKENIRKCKKNNSGFSGNINDMNGVCPVVVHFGISLQLPPCCIGLVPALGRLKRSLGIIRLAPVYLDFVSFLVIPFIHLHHLVFIFVTQYIPDDTIFHLEQWHPGSKNRKSTIRCSTAIGSTEIE